MDAAFDAPPDADEDENSGLLAREANNRDAERILDRIPGDYDFDRTYVSFMHPYILLHYSNIQPDLPPPFQDYSSHNPAPGNTNGVLPQDTIRPPVQSRYFLGGLLPSSFLSRQSSVNSSGRVIGAGNSGIFTNLAARPAAGLGEQQRQDGPEYAPEDEQKDGPPVSWQTPI
jgi:hypothetical protein